MKRKNVPNLPSAKTTEFPINPRQPKTPHRDGVPPSYNSRKTQEDLLWLWCRLVGSLRKNETSFFLVSWWFCGFLASEHEWCSLNTGYCQHEWLPFTVATFKGTSLYKSIIKTDFLRIPLQRYKDSHVAWWFRTPDLSWNSPIVLVPSRSKQMEQIKHVLKPPLFQTCVCWNTMGMTWELHLTSLKDVHHALLDGLTENPPLQKNNEEYVLRTYGCFPDTIILNKVQTK